MVKNYVLDTNTLIHDPECLFGFEDNNVIIPFPVIEEIDSLKTRNDKTSKAARDVNRILDEMRNSESLQKGVRLKTGGSLKVMTLDEEYKAKMPSYLGQSKDDIILFYAMHLNKNDKAPTIIVSKDLNLRIKADSLGLKSQDLLKDKIDIGLIPEGYIEIEEKDLADKSEFTYEEFLNKVKIEEKDIYPNIYIKINDYYYKYSKQENKFFKIITNKESNVFGIEPRNTEQILALDALLDPSINLVSLIGIAGTGKTLLAIAAGLENIIELKNYQKLLVSKPVIPMGKDIGFLPGDIEEKMRPWLQPIYDNLDFLSEGKGRKIQQFLEKNELIEIEVLSYIRGRTIPKQFMIIDEAQNLTPLEIKTILTRVGEDTKIVLTGDPYQIDSPYLDASSNGLIYAASKFLKSELSSHIIMKKGERSKLSSEAAELL